MTSRVDGKEVLVVDDDEAVCEALATLVAIHGCLSSTFTIGRDALRYVREGASPRLILVDARMPDLDGWDFLAELARLGGLPRCSAFLMSADTTLDEGRARDLGARGILHKPFDLEQLSSLIVRYCSDGAEGSMDLAADGGALRESAAAAGTLGPGRRADSPANG